MNRQQLKFFHRLAIHLFILTAVLSVSMALVNAVFLRSERIDAARETLMASSAIKKNLLLRWVEDQHQHTRFLASNQDLREAYRAYRENHSTRNRILLQRVIDRVAAYHPQSEELLVLDNPGGKVAAGSRFLGKDDYYTEFLTRTLQGAEADLLPVSPSPFSTKPVITSYVTIRDQSRILGVLVNRLSLSWVDGALLDVTGLGKTGRSYLVDGVNTLIADTFEEEEAYPRGVRSEGIDYAVSGKSGWGEYLDYRGVPVVGVYEWIDEYDIALISEIETAEVLAPVRQVNWIILGIGSVLFLLFSVIAYGFARHLMDPVASLSSAAAEMEAGNFSVRVPEPKGSELKPLSSAFNTMAERIQNLYQKLSQSEQHFRSLVEHTFDVITVHDTEGTILYISPSVRKMLGYRREDLEGKNIWELIDTLTVGGRTFSERGNLNPSDLNGRDFELLVYDKNNEPHIIEAKGAVIEQENEQRLLVNGRDVSEQRRAAEEHELGRRFDSLAHVAGKVAHDFNNIIAGVVGNLNMAQLSVPAGHEANEYIRESLTASLKARELTSTLLDYAHGRPFSREHVALPPIINKILQDEEKRIHDSSLEVKKDFGRTGMEIEGDRHRLHLMFLEILTNALDSMERDGRLEIKGEFRRLYQETEEDLDTGTYAAILIRDSGKGIPAEKLPRIFDPFYTTSEGSAGMGLSLAYAVAREHGGTLRVSSVIGEGTEVKIYLPVGIETGTSPPTGKKVMIVDDDPQLRSLLGKMLEKIGLSAEYVESGEAAVELYERKGDKTAYSALVIDMVIDAGSGGAEALRILREKGITAPALLMTGYSSDPVVDNYGSYGFVNVLLKPFTLAELRKTFEGMEIL
ncbi:MAG: PAS domain S-box protein [Spirochaetales bacterium]|nr:PAS domain S-box protein [Spirochaetales bacterium]MCF7938954.1 PAS domain S-box protein [Spirochaetales bacterium]